MVGLSYAEAEEYARWLSKETGYDYRMPTLSQWQHAAGTELDPNRNCKFETGTIARGGSAVATGVGAANEYGLLNMAGNVREWVIASGGLVQVAGGAFDDPISVCTPTAVREIGRRGDLLTGFRLVRGL